MGVCCAKKQFKDSVAQSMKIEAYENNLKLLTLNSDKASCDTLDKYYNKILEPLKLLAVTMHKKNTTELDHNYKSNGASSNISALKEQIKKIQAEVKLLHMQNISYKFLIKITFRQLPVQLTNSIFVRQAVSNQNFFKALISGSDNTPYANGLFLYDIYLPDNYPTQCPKMQLMTTGGNSIRFNPNLYSNGYVCLSLLGTWRGDSTESWNPQKSNLLQVLLSIQSLVMSEGVYYNEPSHENDYKTKLGKSLNIGYSNIVRYATVKYAINGMIENPPNGFEDVVNKHFSIKANNIINTLNHWVNTAKSDNSDAEYSQLVISHNSSLGNQFKNDNSAYYNKLKAEVEIATKYLQRLSNEIEDQIEEYLKQDKKQDENIQQGEKEESEQKDQLKKEENEQEQLEKDKSSPKQENYHEIKLNEIKEEQEEIEESIKEQIFYESQEILNQIIIEVNEQEIESSLKLNQDLEEKFQSNPIKISKCKQSFFSNNKDIENQNQNVDSSISLKEEELEKFSGSFVGSYC